MMYFISRNIIIRMFYVNEFNKQELFQLISEVEKIVVEGFLGYSMFVVNKLWPYHRLGAKNKNYSILLNF